MNKSVYMIAALAAGLAAASCTKTIDVDFELQQPRVTVMSHVDAGFPISLRLTYSRFFLSTESFRTIDDATVTLAVNGVAAPAAVTSQDGNYAIAYRPQAGDRLRLDVSVPGQESVSATTTVPSTPVVTGMRMEPHGDGEVRIRFTLEDPADETNYYMLRLIREYTYGDGVTERRYCYFRCQDYMLVDNTDLGSFVDAIDGETAGEWSGETLAFVDDNINGRHHEVSLTVYSSFSSKFYVELTSCSRDRYLFDVTSDLYDDDPFENLFAEPVQIHTNIEGGIGIFAAQNRIEIPVNAND